MAEPTVFEMEIEGVVHPVEDKTARAGLLAPVVNTSDEITALTPEGGAPLALADTKVRAQIEKLTVYSTTEQDTGKVWIDGKKIYRKSFLVNRTGLQPGSQPFVEEIGLGITGVETVLSCSGTLAANRAGTFIQKMVIPGAWFFEPGNTYYGVSVGNFQDGTLRLTVCLAVGMEVVSYQVAGCAEYTKQ